MLHVRQCQDGTESGQAPQCFVRQSRTGLGCGGQLPFDAPVVDQIVTFVIVEGRRSDTPCSKIAFNL